MGWLPVDDLPMPLSKTGKICLSRRSASLATTTGLESASTTATSFSMLSWKHFELCDSRNLHVGLRITLTAGAMGASTAIGAAAGMAAVTGALLKAAGRYLQKDMTKPANPNFISHPN